jgi:oligopeptide transport system permease protein
MVDQPVDLNQKSSPLRDAVRLFVKNRLAVVGLVIIILFILMAMTASLWTELGVIDEKNGFETFHIINAPGLPYADPFADPGTCARDGITRAAEWCELLTPEDRARYPGYCGTSLEPEPERQWCFVMGSDQQGRDLLTQTVYGAQVSLAVAFVGSVVSLILGMLYGLVSGYYGGAVDNAMMRFVDFLYGLPSLVIIILMSVYFRAIQREYQQAEGILGFFIDLNNSMGGLLFLFIALGLLGWIGMARLTRGQVLAYREYEFVDSARALGASNLRIIFVHILPNVIGPLLVVETLAIPGYIFAEAFLSFIGLGVQPGTPSWGAMISAPRDIGGFDSNQYLWLFPGMMLVVLTLAFNFFGDGLRDAFDPRLRGLK